MHSNHSMKVESAVWKESLESNKSDTMNSEMSHQSLQTRYKILLASCVRGNKQLACLMTERELQLSV